MAYIEKKTYERNTMTLDDQKKKFDEVVQPYVDTILMEREQTKFWFDHSIQLAEQYNELLERNHKLREENRKLSMKLLGLDPD